MDQKLELIDDISQVSDISMKTLFKEDIPVWKRKQEEFIEPFYPKPKKTEDAAMHKYSLGKPDTLNTE